MLKSRISKYMAGSDGTKLAVDLYLPDIKDKVPVLIKAGYSPRRNMFKYDEEAVMHFLNAGYAVAYVEVRGSGASYGVSDGFFGLHDGKDMASIIDKLTKEEWCNGRAGTFGGSNHGMIQHVTMLEQPVNLYACAPCDCSIDFYDQDFPNGASALPDMPQHHSGAILGEPVDEDSAPEYPMAHEAMKCHERNLPFLGQHLRNMFRDDLHPYLGYRPNLDIPVWERMDVVRFGHIQNWSIGSWFDPGRTNKILEWKSWGGKLLIGPWPHCGIYEKKRKYLNDQYNWIEEHIRYFDTYLKDKKTGVKEEPPIQYYTVGDSGNEWHYAADFPIDGTTYPKLYLTESGGLSENIAEKGSISYKVREDIMIYGPGMRMNLDIEKDMNAEDEKSLVFTSDPLPKNMEITGIPVMELWVTSTHKDGNFIACLEEVTDDGRSHFLTEGVIRASHKKIHRNNIYESVGIPYHRGYKDDYEELSEITPQRLAFHLEAISRIIRKGSKLRISISCGGSGYQQPENFPKEMPIIKIYTGKEYASFIQLPIIRPSVNCFKNIDNILYVFKRAVYIENNGNFKCYPCNQVYKEKDKTIYELENGRVTTFEEDGSVHVIAEGTINFEGKETLPDRYYFGNQSTAIPIMREEQNNKYKADISDIYVASVPCARGEKGNVNLQLMNMFDIFIDLIYPKGKREKLPCVINIHGFGGNHHQFESNTEMFLAKGYAVASIDYRLSPPNVWPEPDIDAKGCIRYLKAHSDELGLNPERFALIGGSMGGNLTAMLAACNGDKKYEGNIGGNEEWDSSIKVAAAYFAFTDYFHFGDDSAEVWPGMIEKIQQSDGPFAPLGSLIGYVGEGKGMGDVKVHLFDSDPKYKDLVSKAWIASPISHVTEKSAPLCLIHGMFDYGVQVPMGQSVRMFEMFTRKHVKSLLLCNNNCPYGEDPEIKQAVVDFISNRI